MLGVGVFYKIRKKCFVEPENALKRWFILTVGVTRVTLGVDIE